MKGAPGRGGRVAGRNGVIACMAEAEEQARPASVEGAHTPDLLPHVLAYVQRCLGGRLSSDDLESVAHEVIAELEAQRSADQATTPPVVTIQLARRREMVMRPIRVVGRLVDVHDPMVVHLPTGEGERVAVDTSRATIGDCRGDQIELVDVLDSPMVDLIYDGFRAGATYEFTGRVLLLPAFDGRFRQGQLGQARRQFLFLLASMRASSDPLDLLGATPNERSWVQESLADLRADKITPLMMLRSALLNGLRVVDVEEGTFLSDGIDAAILQAVSHGRVMHSPGRVHIQIVGPPGHGKKIVSRAGEALNPTCEQVSPARCSEAGLAGTAFRTRTGWTTEPGALLRAADGIVVVQDAHTWAPARVRQLAPLLQDVMEDGVVRGAGMAGGDQWQISASLLLDVNRASQTGLAGSEAPILRHVPLLSRFDIIIEVPLDVERSWRTGRLMIDEVRQDTGSLGEPTWVRRTRLLVAGLKAEHPAIDLDAVKVPMASAYEAIQRDNAALFHQEPLVASSLSRRVVIQMARLVAASARACDRSHAVDEDVDRAIHFISAKLRFLQTSAVRLSRCPVDKGSREDWIIRTCGGQTVSSSELAQRYDAATGENVSERTMRRSLRSIGAKGKGRGQYLVPGGR